MARKVPGYLHHKASGRAFVILGGRRVYLGEHGTPESRGKYERVLAEWLANGRQVPQPSGALVVEVIAAYWKHAKTYYRREDGTPTGEAERNIRYALRPVRKLYGDALALDFGPSCLEAVRSHMVAEGLSRNVVNQRVGIVRRMFRWAESKELVPRGTFHSLTTLEPLKAGRTDARETAEVAPVEWQDVRATLEHLPAHVAAMVQLQWETAMRPGEVVQMRACDIDRTDPEVWFYRPAQHKNKHRGKDRVVPLLARCQAILQPFLDSSPAGKCLFPPAGRRAKNDQYSTTSYARAISRAITAAGAAHWSPNQLRHAAATRIERALSVEDARLILQHSDSKTTRRYIEPDVQRAIEALRKLG